MVLTGLSISKPNGARANERILNVNIEDGVSVIDRMPGWASGADYATLNNLARVNDGLATGIITDTAIAAYAKNDPYDMYHPSINFREMMLKNTKVIQKSKCFFKRW